MKIRNGFVSNSSSEAFIIDPEIGLDNVKKALQKLVDIHPILCALNGDDYHYTSGNDGDFNSMFKKPKIAGDHECEGWEEYFTVKPGKIIVYSTEDNSIPGWIMDAIEDIFNADRHHLG